VEGIATAEKYVNESKGIGFYIPIKEGTYGDGYYMYGVAWTLAVWSWTRGVHDEGEYEHHRWI
jgi:hypothetical protein